MKYQYKIEEHSRFENKDELTIWLDELGQGGWELVSDTGGKLDGNTGTLIFIFKRVL